MTMTPLTNLIFEENGCPYDNRYQGTARRIVFVCSAGLLRSPTAAVVASHRGYNTRSCGSADYALICLSANLIEWAHKIVFMNIANQWEAFNTFQIDEYYTEQLRRKTVCWDIEDDFEYGDDTLVAEINKRLDTLTF